MARLYSRFPSCVKCVELNSCLLRDIPRYLKLIEKGVIDTKAMITRTYPIERTREAVQDVADRAVLGAVITFA